MVNIAHDIIQCVEGVKHTTAFIDGQNLHLGTTHDGWHVDFARFRIYLKDNYQVEEAYYFLGYSVEAYADLYKTLQVAGFTLVFKEHHSELKAQKKGNVDSDIIFEAMRHIIDDDRLEDVVLVSGDGDYIKLVSYLIQKKKFKKILFPNSRFASSLYKGLGSEYFDFLSHVRSYIEYYKKEKGS